MPTNDDVIERAKARLVSERDHLEGSIRALDVAAAEDGPISRSSDAAADTAAVETQRELRYELETQLEEVLAALGRIEDGTYGIDEVTGQPIDPARLDAIPTARTNI